MKLRSLIFLLLTIAAACGWWGTVEHRERVAQQSLAEFDRKKLAIAQAENDRLRALVGGFEKAKQQAGQLAQRKEIEEATARIRGLSFKQPVTYDVLTREEIQKVLQTKISEQFSDAEFEQIRLGYVALGLIPAGYPLKKAYLELLSEQVAAFYDQHTHRLYMYEDASLDSLQNRIILSHELTHALQDQYFGLKQLPLEAKDNDDRALAASALVEGDATLEMNQFALEGMSWKGLQQSVAGMLTQNMERLQAAPRFLRESLLFPYIEGLRFCTELQFQRGFEGVSAAYGRPPASSSEILHPERYAAGEGPVPVVWSDTRVLDTPPGVDNVLGELGIRILLTDWTDSATATEAAKGWRGDRYLVFNSGKALVWRSRWAGEEEASKFLEACRRMLKKRYGAEASGRSLRVAKVSAGAEVVSREGAKAAKGEGTGTDVLLVDAPDDRWAGALWEKFSR